MHEYDDIGCQICGEEKPSSLGNWTQGGAPHMLDGWLACESCNGKYAKVGKPENFENWPIEEINSPMIKEYYSKVKEYYVSYPDHRDDKWDEFVEYWDSIWDEFIEDWINTQSD